MRELWAAQGSVRQWQVEVAVQELARFWPGPDAKVVMQAEVVGKS